MALNGSVAHQCNALITLMDTENSSAREAEELSRFTPRFTRDIGNDIIIGFEDY